MSMEYPIGFFNSITVFLSKSKLSDFFSLGALLLSLKAFQLNKRNSDTFGVKKIIFDKKLKIYLEIIDKIDVGFSIHGRNNDCGIALSIKFPLSIFEREMVQDYLPLILYFKGEPFREYLNELASLTKSRLVDKEIYDALSFTQWSISIFNESELYKNRVEIYFLGASDEYLHFNQFKTLGEFISKMDNARETIYKWIDKRTDLKGVLRK